MSTDPTNEYVGSRNKKGLRSHNRLPIWRTKHPELPEHLFDGKNVTLFQRSIVSSMRLSESIHYLLSIANCDIAMPLDQSASTTRAGLMSAQDCPRKIAFFTMFSLQGGSEDHIWNAESSMTEEKKSTHGTIVVEIPPEFTGRQGGDRERLDASVGDLPDVSNVVAKSCLILFTYVGGSVESDSVATGIRAVLVQRRRGRPRSASCKDRRAGCAEDGEEKD